MLFDLRRYETARQLISKEITRNVAQNRMINVAETHSVQDPEVKRPSHM